MRALALAAASALPLATSPATGEGLKLERDRPEEVVCATRAIVVAEQQFKATRGELKVSIVVTSAGEASLEGAWRIMAIEAGHSASLGAVHAESCRSGCPLHGRRGGKVELWAPGRLAPAQIPVGQVLVVAAIDIVRLTFHATHLKGNELYALEQGQCRLEPGAAGSDAPKVN
jgi:hypothetical protein